MHPELVPSVPKILMEFYQADALEEEVIKQWGTHVSKKYVDKETSKMVRKACEPFLKVCDHLLRVEACADFGCSGLMKPMMARTMRMTSEH